MSMRIPWVAALSTAVALGAMAACTKAPAQPGDQGDDGTTTDAGSDVVYDSNPPADSSLGILGFQAIPAAYYTGFDGTNTFQVPVAVHDGASDLTVTPDDPTAVTIAPAALANPAGDNGKYFMITALKAAVVTL